MRISLTVKPGTSQEKIVPDLNPDAIAAINTANTNTTTTTSAASAEPTPVYIVYLRAKAVDGAANTALIKLLSKHFHVPKTSIKILRGATSRHKLIELPS